MGLFGINTLPIPIKNATTGATPAWFRDMLTENMMVDGKYPSAWYLEYLAEYNAAHGRLPPPSEEPPHDK